VRRGITRLELAIAIALIAIVTVVALSVSQRIYRAREIARQVCCQSNLRQIGTAIAMYAQDYDDRLPLGSDMRQLEPAIYPYLKNRSIFCCPSDPGIRRAARAWRARQAAGLPVAPKPFPAVPSYAWNGKLSGQDITKTPGSSWAMWDRRRWHLDHRNVVLLDGHARMVPVP
jgi:type II secretory pathway pseudopilin PulG